MTAHTRSLRGLAISPDGMLAASASDGPIICHARGPLGLAPGIFGTISIGCGPDYGIVRLFDIATGNERATLKHDWTAYSVTFSPDGKLLASGGGGVATLWDPATNKARIVTKVESERDVYSVAFSPDGHTLAVGVGSRDFRGSYGDVRLCDVASGRVRALLQSKQAGKIRSLAFAPDGKTLATGSSQAVLLWDVPPMMVAKPRSRAGF
jgi:WD40 repeat protein